MNAGDIVAPITLFLGVGLIMACCAGILTGDAHARLHFLGPASVLAPWLIAVASGIRFFSIEAVIKGILLALILMLTGPVLTHATAKAIHRPRPDLDQTQPDGDSD